MKFSKPPIQRKIQDHNDAAQAVRFFNFSSVPETCVFESFCEPEFSRNTTVDLFHAGQEFTTSVALFTVLRWLDAVLLFSGVLSNVLLISQYPPTRLSHLHALATILFLAPSN